jgi:arylsulfatase A-like enzyme
MLALPLLISSVSSAAPSSSAPSNARPNIIVILADDMGFSDLGCYGSEIPTPNLDTLSKEGLKFTDFHNDSRCCPSRATLLTGLYPHAAGVGHMTDPRKDTNGVVLPGYLGHLNNNCVTIAEVLQSAGYFTAMTGKWHVGQTFTNGVVPWKRGFDRSLDSAAGGFYYPQDDNTRLFLNGHPEGRGGRDGLSTDWYSTDLWTDYGLKFIDEAQAQKKPFFLYLAYNAPHFPLQAPDEDIAKFRGKYMEGWDKLREARYQKQIQLGIIDKSWPLSPRPAEVAAWDSLTPEQKDRFDHIMAIYAACVYHVDKEVGVLVAGLAKRGLLDNTLIMFMSDNGGNLESGPRGRLEGDNPGGPQSTVYCGQSWATLENTPFRRYKHFEHEGGISSPFIVHWPSGIAAKGELRMQPGHLVDIMATCIDVSGAKYPSEYNGHSIHPIEGRSLVPAFANQPIQRDAIYWEHEGNAAVLQGDWKLVRFQWDGPWELYNVKADRTEQQDLSAKYPDRVKELAAKWKSWAKADNVLPVMRENHEKEFHATANDGYGGTPPLREPSNTASADGADDDD